MADRMSREPDRFFDGGSVKGDEQPNPNEAVQGFRSYGTPP